METTKSNQKTLNVKDDLRAKTDTILSDLRLLEPSLYIISKRNEGWEEEIEVAKLQLRTISLSCKTYLNWMRDVETADKRKKQKH